MQITVIVVGIYVQRTMVHKYVTMEIVIVLLNTYQHLWMPIIAGHAVLYAIPPIQSVLMVNVNPVQLRTHV